MTDKIKYTRVDDAGLDGEPPSTSQRQRTWITALGSFLIGLFTMGVVVAVSSAFLMPESSRARHLPKDRNGSDPITGVPLAWSNGDCGNSPREAKQRECLYSIVLHAWLPKSCLTEADEEDAKDMYSDRDWFYENPSGKNMTMEELGTGDYEHFQTTYDWHVTHCMYVWKRLHRVMMDPSQELDSYTASYHHTSHCVKMIGGDMEEMKKLGTKTFVKYPNCAK